MDGPCFPMEASRAQLLDMGFAEHQFEAYLGKGLDTMTLVAILGHQQEEAEAQAASGRPKKKSKVSPRL